MTPLRWILGLLAALAALAWALLAVVGGGFRRSFGASDYGVPLAAAAVIAAALVVASVVWPERRALLHVVAVVMLGLCVASVVLLRETVFVGTLGLLYAIAWLVFYYRVVWAVSAAS